MNLTLVEYAKCELDVTGSSANLKIEVGATMQAQVINGISNGTIPWTDMNGNTGSNFDTNIIQ